MHGGCKQKHFNRGKQITICQSLFFASKQGDEATSTSFKIRCVPIDASSLSMKALMQLDMCKGDEMGNTLPMTNKYLFASRLLSMSGEGDEAPSPSFTTCYVAIEGSSVSLEVLIASLLHASGTTKEVTFPIAIKFLFVVRFLLACVDGKPTTPPSCVSICPYNALL